MHLVLPQFTHSTTYRLWHKVDRASMYKLEHFGYCIYLYFVHLLKYEVIILERHLMRRSELFIGCNQTSSLIKLSTLSSVLVKVYELDDKNPPSCLLVMVRVYWQNNKETLLVCHWVRWWRFDTSKPLVLTRVLAWWLGFWRVIRYNPT